MKTPSFHVLLCSILMLCTLSAVGAEASLVCSVERSDWEASYAVLSWDASIGCVCIERRIQGGEWETIGESETGHFVDLLAPYGRALQYRIVSSDAVSPEVPFLRMRRLYAQGYPIFSTGSIPGGWGKPPSNAFDADRATYPDMYFEGTAILGVDFGSASNTVAHVRIFSRTDGVASRIQGTAFYGSDEPLTELGQALTSPIVYENRVYEYAFDLPEPTAYRSYSVVNDGTTTDGYGYGNVSEVELYGWSRDDYEQTLDPFGMHIARSSLSDFLPTLTWNSALPHNVTIQIAPTEEGPWGNRVTLRDGASSWTDTRAPIGQKRFYRLVVNGIEGKPTPFLRLRKLEPADFTLFSQGSIFSAGTDHRAVFDGDIHSYADLMEANDPKIGVDFGKADHIVAMLRVHPRNLLLSRMAGLRLFGSMLDADTERLSEESGTPLTEPILAVPSFTWYEIPLTEEPHAWRTYYVRNLQGYGNIAEVELYGWTADDLRPHGTLIRLY